MHISELAQHHVENPREIIQPGDPVRVKILEIDSERRRLSLSIKRVEGQVLPVRPITAPTDGDAGDLDNVPELGLSEDVFAGEEPAAAGGHRPATVGGHRPQLGGPDEQLSAEHRRAAAADPQTAGGHRPATAGGHRPATAGGHRPSVCRPTPTARATPRPRPGQRWAPPTSYRKLGRTPDSPVPFVGLTGGIGAGKSTALEALERVGAAVLSTDASSTSCTSPTMWSRPSGGGSATRSLPGASSTGPSSPGGRSRRPRTASGSKASCGRAWDRACSPGGPRSRPRPTNPSRPWSRCRCCSNRAWTACLTRRSR